MKIGTNKGFTKFTNRDPNPDIPFVEPEPPMDGLLALWGVCTALALLLSAYLIWGSKWAQ